MGTNKEQPDNEDVLEFSQIICTLKEIMRERKVSYRDLAMKIGLSESGIKKIFYAEDCSYRRLSQICKVLDCRIVDILDQVDREKKTSVQFTAKQQRTFLKDPLLFSIFINLVIERQSSDEVQSKYNLSDQKYFAKLKKLDELNLVTLKGKGNISLPPLPQVVSFGDGPLLTQMYKKWSQSLVEAFANPKMQQSGKFIIRGMSLRNETYNELKDRLIDLDREFLRRGIREMNTFSKEIRPFRWISIIDRNSLTDEII